MSSCILSLPGCPGVVRRGQRLDKIHLPIHPGTHCATCLVVVLLLSLLIFRLAIPEGDLSQKYQTETSWYPIHFGQSLQRKLDLLWLTKARLMTLIFLNRGHTDAMGPLDAGIDLSHHVSRRSQTDKHVDPKENRKKKRSPIQICILHTHIVCTYLITTNPAFDKPMAPATQSPRRCRIAQPDRLTLGTN